ncbi:DUF4129 domain-containing protein [Sphingomonas parva]|uniref:DUF4129 domain-containing protein n=1 Tax=Sphingomonas parva TaxID=2555898 RepID=A0A4Y8ZVT8_9SPHN|nr:DUF4129 domain-containing protein [Sphingomonas parva]TFI59245.1 DUF4129 domain-containing protein [Sphingomonas parva]
MANTGGNVVAATGDPARFEQAHAALRADSSIQFDLPGFEPPVVPGWVRWLGQFLEGSGPALKAIFWIVVAAAVLALLYALFRWIERGGLGFLRRDGQAVDDGEGSWRPEEAPARALLAEADALAAAGRFDEAVHLLLFRSIEEIEAKRPKLVRPALTSRDIAGAERIPAGPRTAFGRIVMAVERSLFGGRALGEGDWRGCRAAYEEFAFAAEWGR